LQKNSTTQMGLFASLTALIVSIVLYVKKHTAFRALFLVLASLLGCFLRIIIHNPDFIYICIYLEHHKLIVSILVHIGCVSRNNNLLLFLS